MERDQPPGWTDFPQRIRDGDATAEEELAGFFYPQVLSMARIRLREPEAARDIAQETVLAVLQAARLGKIREDGKLAAFVLGTARNLINNHLRARSLNRDLVPLPAEMVAPTPTQGSLEEQERRAQVRAALEHLGPQDRKILLLTLVDGMNPREIAPLMGLKPETIRTRKSRAIKCLSQEITRLTRK